MRQPFEFIGHHVMDAQGRLWQHRTCNAPFVVVEHTHGDRVGEIYLRGLCSKCLTESYRNYTDGQQPVDADWHTKLAMTRSERWPAWASKGVFDIE